MKKNNIAPPAASVQEFKCKCYRQICGEGEDKHFLHSRAKNYSAKKHHVSCSDLISPSMALPYMAS